ncbi:MAG: cation transporter, partial [Novosphingobium sp.]|nr:cation transporter [Novosphingobium sp.]
MSQQHQHHHTHRHAHVPPNAHVPPRRGRSFALAVGLNVAFVVAEVAAGLVSGSMALIADA